MKYTIKDSKFLERIKESSTDFKSRRMRILEKEFERSSEFLILSQKEHLLYKRLKTALPEGSLLLADYSDVLTETEALRQYFFYNGGFDDAIHTHKLLSHRYIRH